MHKTSVMILPLGLAILLVACSRTPPSTPLPTATLAPTRVPPTATPSPLPPPTVTPYPTATPGASPTQEPSSTSGDETPQATALAETAATPSAEPSQTSQGIERGEVILTSDFSRGWPTLEDASAKIYIENGGYVFDLGVNARRYVNTSSLNRDDFLAQVQVTPQACPAGGGYGLFFRFQDEGNYYALTVFCDGRVTVFERAGGRLNTTPLLDASLPDGLSAVGPDTHIVGVAAQGESFTMYFDGQPIGAFTSETHGRGGLAIYAVSAVDSPLRVVFDNLEVWTIR